MTSAEEVEFELSRHELFGDSQRIVRRRDQFYECAVRLLASHSSAVVRFASMRGLSSRSLYPLVHDPVARLDLHEALRALKSDLPAREFIESLDWYLDRLLRNSCSSATSLLRAEQREPGRLAASALFVWSHVIEDAPISQRFEEQFDTECLPNRLVGTISSGELIKADAEQVNAVACSLDRLSARLPLLMSDLLEHVDVVCWANVGLAGVHMQSGSVRAIPGVVFINPSLMSDSRTLDEALLHEAVHCKLFDIYVCSGVLRSDYSALESPRVDVPWNRANQLQTNAWPLDQALAALHVYVHLWLYGLVVDGAADLVHRSQDRAQYLLRELNGYSDRLLDSRGRLMVACIGANVARLQAATNNSRRRYQSPAMRFVDGSPGGYGIAKNPTEIVLLNEKTIRTIEEHLPGDQLPADLVRRQLVSDIEWEGGD